MEADDSLHHGTEAALAAFRWIKGLAMAGNFESSLLGDAGPPRRPTVYDTSVTDQEVLLAGGTPSPVPGFRLTLRAGGPNGHEVAVDDIVLGVDDYRFTYMDDVLHLDLRVGVQTFGARAGLYRTGCIRFAPSGRTFTGLVSRTSPETLVTYKWDGTVAPGG
ncbi:hypothetical protein [Azospirillum halopraeferens]|uniref:hypothetical protein n=1 Tax=Azospirillum halopraeferens TaxID=34010 RepID=UPI000429EC2D|nr:hypothetical protein [Azospirillum halopraeferens]